MRVRSSASPDHVRSHASIGSPRREISIESPASTRSVNVLKSALALSPGHVVAEMTGCSRATLYRRFASKLALVEAILFETSRAVEPEIASSEAPRAILIAHASACAEYMSGSRGRAILSITESAARLPELDQATLRHMTGEQEYYYREFRRLAPGAWRELGNACLYLRYAGRQRHLSRRHPSPRAGRIRYRAARRSGDRGAARAMRGGGPNRLPPIGRRAIRRA